MSVCTEVVSKLNKECIQVCLQLITNGKIYTKGKPNGSFHPIRFFLTRDCKTLYWMSAPLIGFSTQKQISLKEITKMEYESVNGIFTIQTSSSPLKLCIPSEIDMAQLYQVLLVCKAHSLIN